MSDKHDLALLIKGHVPVIVIESFEESRALELLTNIGLESMTPVFRWSATEGLKRHDIDIDEADEVLHEATDVLRHIKVSKVKGIYTLLDFHPYLDDPINQRLIKEIAMFFEDTGAKLVLISPELTLPTGLAKLFVNFQLLLPSSAEIEKIIVDEAVLWQRQHQLRVKTDRTSMTRLVKNLSGLTHKDARRIIRNAIMDDNAISESDLPGVMDAKYQLLNQDDLLSFEYDTAKLSEVGGMRRLKEWLNYRHGFFQDKNELPKGLDKPKGILLLGVQGGGKSLTAKAVAGVWGIPLLRMDFGMLYNKYVGETEKNIRQALNTAEAMSPCVLWIDEIEKGISTGNNDDGTSKRILGTLLTWLAENKKSVFVVATANQIDDLPPELIRKGRMDEIFFVDLPKPEVRELIFKIHLEKREIPLIDIDLKQLSDASEGFSGAEIEQAIVAVVYTNHSTNKVMTTDDILTELEQTRPLSIVMAEKIAELRLWASERTVPAD